MIVWSSSHDIRRPPEVVCDLLANIQDVQHNEMTNDELRQAIFVVDQDKGLEADVFLIVLDDRVPD